VGDHVGASFVRLLIVGGACALVARPCAAHVAGAVNIVHPGFDAVLAGLLLAASLFYARGVARVWIKAGTGRGIRIGDVCRFALGMLSIAAALLSPIDALADRSFALHMVEHEMLMVVAAPLLVLARPMEAWVWALQPRTRQQLAPLVRVPALASSWRAMTGPVPATCLHAVALWTWHVPVFFAAALASLPLHILQHFCFFASALAFWWAMVGGAPRSARPVSLACLFATMLQTSALGALLTFAPSPWYVQADEAPVFGLTPLENQQLGGLVMWVPGALAYVIVGLLVVASWLARPASSRRASTLAKATVR
jgi:putative membrane protein